MAGQEEREPTGLNEAILRGLHQLTDRGILTTDAQLTVTGWSRWLEVNSGRRAEEVVGRHLFEAFPELVERRLSRFYRQALDGQLIVLSQRLHKYLLPMPLSAAEAGLSHMQQSARIAPLVGASGVVGTLTVIEDVTERVAHEAELRARARQQAAVAVIGQRALAGGDLSVLMGEVIDLAVQTLAAAGGEVLELLPNGEAAALRAGAGLANAPPGRIRVEAGPGSQAGYVLQADGPVVIADLSLETRFRPEPLLRASGVASGLAVQVVDGGRTTGALAVYAAAPHAFTEDHVQFLQALANVLGMAAERKRLEKELRERAAELTVADRRKDEFLAMLAHELRNPLAPIRNAVQVLRLSGEAGAQTQWAREIIERQVQQMTRLVDDLLDVSRITRGKINFQKEPLELAAVVARAVETSRPFLDARRHELTVQLPARPIFLEGDAARLAQVVGNLLNNAAKYTPEGGKVWLAAEQEHGEVVLRVRDTGVGIPEEMLPRVFDLFTQVDRSLDRSEGGLGIGLTLVRSLVELHGGRVEALSAGPDQGSEFVVHLPTVEQPGPPASPIRREDPAPTRSASRRILVVDDNRDAAGSLALMLRVMGNDVHTVHDGAAALQAVRTFRPEVVLLDIGLPGMTGYEVARHLRRQPETANPLLIALTGYGQEEDRRRSQDAGFDHHLVKPVSSDALQSLLARSPATNC